VAPCGTVTTRYAAFTPAQLVARNKLLVARNKLRVAQLVAGNLRATCNKRATCCALVARNKLRATIARNLLRWCKRGIRQHNFLQSVKPKLSVMGTSFF